MRARRWSPRDITFALGVVFRGNWNWRLALTYTNWQDAADSLNKWVGPSTDSQNSLAKAHGLELPTATPYLIAAARLRVVLAAELGYSVGDSWSRIRGVSISQALSFDLQDEIERRANEIGASVPVYESPEEARAWLQHFYLIGRLEALRHLKLNKGDIVRRVIAGDLELEEVASIDGQGLVYFVRRGGRAWPDVLTLVARREESTESAKASRRGAANRAAAQDRLHWSGAKAKALEANLIEALPSIEEIGGLSKAIESAADEAPIQEFLERHPRLFAPLLRGPSRYCVPRVRFGAKWVSDFCLAEVDSSGIRWTLVELETPHSTTVLSSGNKFERHARQGITQIDDWRRYIENNLDAARRSRDEDGLGLVDIALGTDALVLVGRRHQITPASRALRQELWRDKRILMHTYDWFVETLESALTFSGPSAFDPHLLSNAGDDSSPD